MRRILLSHPPLRTQGTIGIPSFWCSIALPTSLSFAVSYHSNLGMQRITLSEYWPYLNMKVYLGSLSGCSFGMNLTSFNVSTIKHHKFRFRRPCFAYSCNNGHDNFIGTNNEQK